MRSLKSHSGARHDPKSPAVTARWPVEVDLHLHTTASDGVKTPSEVVEIIDRSSVRVFSITDHDTTDGLDEAMRAMKGRDQLTLIPGIELSTYSHGSEIHLTCHFIDIANDSLQSTLDKLAKDRATKAKQIVERLNHLGVKIEWCEVSKLAGGSVGRPHIARSMVAAGYVDSIADAFDKYLDTSAPAYVSRMKLDTFEALKLIHQAGGTATVAHPRTVDDIESLIGPLADAGLAAMEVYAEKYSAEMVRHFEHMADQHDLIKSGGTDYHANGTPNEVQPGMNGPPPDTARLLYKRAVSMHGADRVGAKFDIESL